MVNTLADLERRYVEPFYLGMMGLNAANPHSRHEVQYETLRELGRQIADDDVARLLATSWRPRVMGAWLATGRARRLETVLLRSLETSGGTLTAPPLAVVALHGLGATAIPALQSYLREDLQHDWGAAPFIAAVLERLGAVPAEVAVEDQDRGYVDRMLGVARRLAGETVR